MRHKTTVLLLLLAVVHATPNTAFTTTCVCDVDTSCDYRCCCDTTCNSQLRIQWQSYGLCTPTNSNGLSIPSCSDTQTLHISDLHSGMRTLFTVIKRLFCLTRINADIGIYTGTYTQYLDSKIETLTEAFSDDSFTKLESVDLQKQYLEGEEWGSGKLRVPGVNWDRRCSLEVAAERVDRDYVVCNSAKTGVSTLANVGSYEGLFGTANVTYQYFGINGSQITKPTATCSAGTCVRNARIQISFNRTIDSISIDLTIDPSVSLTGPTTIQQSFSIHWLYPNSTKLSGSMGYSYNSPIHILSSDSSLQTSPIWLKFYSDSLGTCSTTTTSSIQTKLQLLFGRDTTLTCLGTTLPQLTSTITYISRLGSTLNNKNDYILVNNTNVTGGSSAILSIYFIRIGEEGNAMFEIVSASLVEVKESGEEATRSLFVEWKEVMEEAQEYVPLPPSIQVYLPNDVLYPFYYQ